MTDGKFVIESVSNQVSSTSYTLDYAQVSLYHPPQGFYRPVNVLKYIMNNSLSQATLLDADGYITENEIIIIDIPVFDHARAQASMPDLTAELLADMADELADIGAHSFSARMEIERRHFVEHDDYLPAFAGEEITAIGTSLLIAHLMHFYQENEEPKERIQQFGRCLSKGADGEIGIAIGTSNGTNQLRLPHDDEIRLFEALAGNQLLLFKEEVMELPNKGEPLPGLLDENQT